MRCPDCNKFASLELQDPEVSEEEYSDGSITATVRIVRNCADCSTELKEATFEVDEQIDFCSDNDSHKVSLEYTADTYEEGGGRYKKAYYGASIEFTLKCSCGRVANRSWKDKIPASSMDELV